MFINTVGFYTGSITLAGSPGPFSITPAFYSAFTDNMNLWQRILNSAMHLTANICHRVTIQYILFVLYVFNLPHLFAVCGNAISLWCPETSFWQ